jgi:hypothetical protein
MRNVFRLAALLVITLLASAAADDGPRRIAVLDDCDPSDAGWTSLGGCFLDGGLVSLADFLAAAPIGHPSWRNDPSYLKITSDKHIDVINYGGRTHSFTEVAEFGGGVVPPLNLPGQGPVQECLDLEESLMPPGAKLRLPRLQEGTHKYQCCFHPWMRAEVRVR